MPGSDAGNEASDAPDASLEQQQAQADTEPANFDPGTWEPVENRYGIVRLLGLREAMLPIEKPDSIKSFKFLFFPGHGLDTGEAEEREKKERGGDRKDRGDRPSKGKSKGKEKQPQGGRFVPEMGKTELVAGYVRNQWFRNVSDSEVIIRDGFSLMSQEVWKVPAGHYVQQAGPAEVFVSGQATGLTRMPCLPKGWATADATAVGGPKYLEPVRAARWEVSFRSDAPRGDILVRQDVSLESEEVGCIRFGSYVLQSGPQETLEDGIIRMPISWAEASQGGSPTTHNGWVTCDASSQGGPKFFTAAPEEDEPAVAAPASSDKRVPREEGWDKNRLWKVCNLDDTRMLPLVTRAEPYIPGTGRTPPEDIVVRWLKSDDVVEQIGHSKKTRGCMVMPVKMVYDEKGNEVNDAEGWVTRRLVDKQRESEDTAWLVELRDGDGNEREQRRAHRRDQRQADRG